MGKRAGISLGLGCVAISFVARLHSIPRLSAYWDALVWSGLYIAATIVLSEFKKLYERERSLSRVDSLTHIGNRRALLESAAATLNFAKRHHTTISLAYIDLDDFKKMNDLLGHATGDKVLRAVAASIRDALRPTDLVARIGGDELAVLLPETTKAAAGRVMDRVRLALDRAMRERSWATTFSIGIVTFLRPPRSISEMLGKADHVMYGLNPLAKTAPSSVRLRPRHPLNLRL